MQTTTSLPASAPVDTRRKPKAADPADLADLSVAPPSGTFSKTAEQQARNDERGERAGGYFWGECYSDNPDRPLRKLMHALDRECDGRLTADGRRESPSWTRADIADDGSARVMDRNGTWRAWSPPTRLAAAPSTAINAPATGAANGRRTRSGREARPASNDRTRGGRRSPSRSSSSSGDSGDGEPGEPEPRRCPCGRGEPLTGKQVYASDACRKRVARDNPHYRWSACSEADRQAIWRRLGGGELVLAAVVGFINPRELFFPDDSGPAPKAGDRQRVRDAYRAVGA